MGDVDLNETAREQDIMTDEEFQSVLNQVQREEEDAEGMAEGLDLASQAGGSVNPEEPMVEHTDAPTQSVGEGDSDKQAVPEPEVPVVDSEVAKPSCPKTKEIRRKLVLKDDPKAKRPKPSRVSQRCLGRWATKRAGSNTASEAVDISSEEEGEVPANSGEKTPPTEDEEAQVEEQKEVSPRPTAQEETPAEEEPIQTQVPESPGQEEPSTEAQRSPNQEEERYQLDRKRKGKAPAQKKQPAMKARTAEPGIVFREQPREEISDGDYSASEEAESEDESLEDETLNEQQLPSNHWELVHPPVERIEYQPWQVDLDDDLMEAMKRFDTEKLQDAFDGKDDTSNL